MGSNTENGGCPLELTLIGWLRGVKRARAAADPEVRRLIAWIEMLQPIWWKDRALPARLLDHVRSELGDDAAE